LKSSVYSRGSYGNTVLPFAVKAFGQSEDLFVAERSHFYVGKEDIMEKRVNGNRSCFKCLDSQGHAAVETFDCSCIEVCCESYLDTSIQQELLTLRALVNQVNHKISVNEEILARKRLENFVIGEAIKSFMDSREERKVKESSCSCLGKCIIS
jgi:hypothetical protein